MKKIFILATAAVALASCSDSDLVGNIASSQQTEQPQAVEFGTYMGTAATRANYVGPITLTQLQDGKTGSYTQGFGVFAHYESTGNAYNTLVSRLTNFMYNEQIYYSSGWKYDNIKYWPNGQNTSTTAADDENATSTSVNKVSFFAYAPFVGSTTSNTYGITGISANNAMDNPKITYTLSNANFVDLLWGTAGTNGVDVADNAQNGAVISTTANGTATAADAGYANVAVNADLTKQKVDGVVQFAFKHALAQVGGYSTTNYGGLSVIADIDNNVNETTPTIAASTEETGGTLDPSKTKVTITSITITPDRTDSNSDNVYDNAMPTVGVLDLATGSWTNTTATQATQLDFTHVINNNPSSGQYELNSAIKSPASITQWSDVSSITGVLSTAPTNVYKEASATPLILLPGTTPSFTVTIQYEVCTHDTKLTAGCSIVTQTITKTITFAQAVKMNKKYNLLIHLGLTGIKFDATVADWSEDINDDTNVDATDTQTINLPINVK